MTDNQQKNKIKFKFIRKLPKRALVLSGLYLAIDINYPQRGADIRGILKGSTNSLIAFPVAGISVFDYIYGLKGLKYGTEEYKSK